MNPQEKQQVAARDDKWVPFSKKDKISSTNIRLETTQFWYSIKKVQGTDSYKFLLANKKCTINAEVFRTLLDICPRVEGVDFTDVPDDDTALTFLIDLRYKGEDYQEYGLPIPETMLTEAIKQSKTYQMFIKYSTESELEPKHAKKKTSSKRRVKKKVTLSANDNIISDDPVAALEFAKSSKSVVIQDTISAPKSKPTTSKTKLKGASSLTLKEQEAANIIQALKESKKTSRRQPGTEDSNEGNGSKPRVPDESTVISATSSEGTGIKLGVPNEEKDITEEKVILEWGDEQDSEHSDDDNDDVEKDDKDGDGDDEGIDHISDTQDVDDEDVKIESDEDDIYKYEIRVRKDEDEEMINAEVDDSDKVPTPVQESPLIATVTTLPPPYVSTTPPVLQQTTIPIPIQPITIDAPTVTIAVPESNALTVVELKVAKLEIDMSDLKTVDHSTEALVILKSQVPFVVDNYLGSKVRDVFQKELKKHTTNLIQKYSLQQFSKSSKK
ncbi:hypothetical protein Tco_0658004 [Tanacetum coccineum]